MKGRRPGFYIVVGPLGFTVAEWRDGVWLVPGVEHPIDEELITQKTGRIDIRSLYHAHRAHVHRKIQKIVSEKEPL